jgi:hypothetical protein
MAGEGLRAKRRHDYYQIINDFCAIFAALQAGRECEFK